MTIIEKAVDKLASEKRETRAVESGGEVDSGQERLVQTAEEKGSAKAAKPDVAGANFGRAGVDIREPSQGERQPDIAFADLGLEGVVSPEGGRSRLDEEYRMIKRPILVKAFSGEFKTSQPLNLVMVTSALSGEGKTFTTMNLAISIAMEMDRTVLLIDADLAKPSMSRLIGISDRPGFTECLKDDRIDIGQYMLRTDVPKLTVLPAGKRNNRATELLASKSMTARLQELSARYSDRIVLFDSPPLLATSEATVLASHMGQVAMVVEYGATPQLLVREALGHLKNKDAVSLILNKTRDDFLLNSVGGYGYGYGKGYGYGAYGER
ncbi:MAG: XrtA-associated tyrosine autokinase [Gammaproteobacteria bacterium]|nr:XrtA-associated tyrosine autokinase [Gammaproteobacteria bacterium]